MDKRSIRQEMIIRRKQLGKHEVTAASQKIVTTLLSEIKNKPIKCIHIYQSNDVWNEIQTTHLQQTIRASLPAASLAVGRVSQNAPLPTESFDLIIVPLLAFDAQLHRLGFGGGWYDRFLANQPNALAVGFAYELQFVNVLPRESHDIPLSTVITEKTIYRR